MYTYIHILWISGIVYKGATLQEFFLLGKKAGGGTSLSQLWHNTSFPNNSNVDHGLFTLMDSGDFRSGRIDNWQTDPPDIIYVELLNDNHDFIFWIAFDSTNSIMDLSSWFNSSRIVESSLGLISSEVDISVTPYYDVYVHPKGDSSVAWLAIFNGTTQPMDNAYPIFLFSRNMSSPYPLQWNFGLSGYEGCHQFSTGDITYLGTTDIKLCISECSNSGYPNLLLGYSCKCYCGDIANSFIQYQSQCSATAQPHHCAIVTGMYAVYNAGQGDASSELQQMTSVYWNSFTITLTPNMNNTLLNFTQYLPDFNPVYIMGISISSALEMIFQIDYSPDLRCSDMTKLNTMFNGLDPLEITSNGTLYNTTVTDAWCLILRFHPPNDVINITVKIFKLDRNFVHASYLVISGFWNPTVTNSSSTTQELTETTTDGLSVSTVTNSSSTTQELTETTTDGSPISTENPETSSLESTLDEQSTSTTTAVTPTPTQTTDNCACTCDVIIDLDKEISPELQQKLDEMKSELTVEKYDLSSYTRTKISAKDDRPSSRGIGSIGIIFLTAVMVLIVSIDLINFYDIIRQQLMKLKAKLPYVTHT